MSKYLLRPAGGRRCIEPKAVSGFFLDCGDRFINSLSVSPMDGIPSSGGLCTMTDHTLNACLRGTILETKVRSCSTTIVRYYNMRETRPIPTSLQGDILNYTH